MASLRLGDDIDDYCIKCKRVTNHSILAIVDGEPVKVRCRSCYNEGPYRRCVVPPSKRELQKAALMKQMLEQASPPPAPAAPEKPKKTAGARPAAKQAAKSARRK
ncbi:MAG: hypothetical protein KatS3mg005_3336 [Bryobacteraceae bacterium]|nr:MAG: hypothetical protein KatS3mg005_3336 [Bryobacteraceae bacterium]